MILKNRFKEVDKIRYWIDEPFCHWQEELCCSNQGCALHHIDGTSSSSIFNSIMLCDKHHKIADTHNTNSPSSAEFRKILRDYTYARVMRIGKILTKDDIEYLTRFNLKT